MTHTRRTAGLWAAAACAFLVGCEETAPLGPESAAPTADPVEISLDRTLGIQSHKKLSTDLCSPALGGFTTVSTNPYFPMEVGDQWSYEGEEDDAEVALLITVLDETRIVDGVTTRVIEEREWEDDELLEISWNYYAQAGDGTICYFGEDVDIYEEGGGIVHEGAWCAPAGSDGRAEANRGKRGVALPPIASWGTIYGASMSTSSTRSPSPSDSSRTSPNPGQ